MDKNRIYLSGTSIMSTKLTVSLAMRNKYCEQLSEADVQVSKIRRCNFLEKQQRANCYNKMKTTLNAVAELQAKYVSLSEYKKHSCINIDKLVPELKFKKVVNDSDEEEISEKREEQIKINKRKRRRYKNSFINANNLV